METYLIQHKVKTLSKLGVGLNDSTFPKMDLGGFLIEQWDFNISEGWLGDAWLVEKNIQADSCEEAIKIFRSDLDKIVPKLAFISQCYMDFYMQPFLIKKINEPDNIFFFKYTEDHKGVSLHFSENEFKSYKKIGQLNNVLFRYLQECQNCTGYIPRLMLLFAALEALCGKKEKNDTNGDTYITYNHKIMKDILSKEFFNNLYGSNGIRHKLQHGDVVDFIFQQDYVDIIYKKIIKYINNKYNTKIVDDVVSSPRHFHNNNGYLNFWLKPCAGFNINLKQCIANFSNDNGMYVKNCEQISVDSKSY
jgi:hypothetical protein